MTTVSPAASWPTGSSPQVWKVAGTPSSPSTTTRSEATLTTSPVSTKS